MIKANRQGWWKAGALGVFVFLVAYWSVSMESGYRGPVQRTTYSTAPGGYKALYLWLQRLDVPTRRWQQTLAALTSKASVLLLVQPEITPRAAELDALEGWVRKGGTLLLVQKTPGPFLERFQLTLQGRPPAAAESGRRLWFQPGPYSRGVRTLLSCAHPGLSSSQPEAVCHIRDAWGVLMAVKRIQMGRVIAVADPTLFCNASLGQRDNSRLALNLLLTHRGQGPVLVDEYHHGYGRATSILGHLRRSGALTPLLQALALVLVIWAYAGRRFGPARPLVEDEHRCTLEYVQAMGELFRRARARNLALKTIVGWIESEAARRLIDKDHHFRRTVEAARSRLRSGDLTDGQLLVQVRTLYGALNRALNRAPGGSSGDIRHG